MIPVTAPLMEKAFPGSHGKIAGTKTAPANIPAAYAKAAMIPLDQASFTENISVPIPDRRKNPSNIKTVGFTRNESSTGTSTRRSDTVKVTRRIDSSAFFPASKNCFMSFARIGPHITLNPHPFFTSIADTPVAESWGRISSLWFTILSRPETFTLFITSSVEKRLFPAAHHTFIPRVSSTRIQALSR